MSSIFVTGGAGLIGLACVEVLLKAGHINNSESFHINIGFDFAIAEAYSLSFK